MIPIIWFNILFLILLFMIIVVSILINLQSTINFKKRKVKKHKEESIGEDKSNVSIVKSEWNIKNATTLNTQCQYQADVGYVCPLNMKQSTSEITPYQKCPKSIQNDVLEHLCKEWGNEYTHEYIERNWATGDIMYVLMIDTEKSGKEFVGSVAVDRKNFTPTISQLYVVPKYRKKGYSKRLIEFAVHYVKTMEFKEVKLWCKPELVDFYENQGWKVERELNKNTHVMTLHIE